MEELRKNIKRCHPKSWFKPGQVVIVNDKMQYGKYTLIAPYGKLDPSFTPELSPKQMLAMGVFEGKYLCDAVAEFPREWFPESTIRKLSPQGADPSKNYYGIKSRLSLQEWERKGWITKEDPNKRGWFQWYCRYYIGWRNEEIDKIQIKRHRAFIRHVAQLKKHCKGDQTCRIKQRQAVLQWAYDPRLI